MANLISVKYPVLPPELIHSRADLCEKDPKDEKCNNSDQMGGITNFGMVVNDIDMDVEKNGGGGVDLNGGLAKRERRNSTVSSISSNLNHNPNNKPTKDGNPEKKTFARQYGGMLLALTASVLFSIVVLLVKKLQSYGMQAEDSSFWRYAGIMFPSIPLLMYYECGAGKKSQKTESVFDTVWPLNRWDKWKTVIGLLSRGILGSSSVILRYYALQYLTIGDTSVISYSSPILVTILAHFLLGERTGFVPILTAILALVGVVVITRPPLITGEDSFDNETLIGTAFATGSLVCSALMTIITRKIRSVQFALMLIVFGSIGMLQAFLLSQFLPGAGGLAFPQGTTDTLMLAGVAVLSFVGQMSIILSLKMEQAGIVSLIRTGDVVFGFIVQFIFLGVAPDIYSGIGGSVVFFGIVVTALRKYLSTLPKDNGTRKFFFFLLY